MSLSDICIKRPVLATVMSLMLVLFGAICFTRLPVREYPDIDSPVVSVNTVYLGASPETVETSITEPIEEQLTTIEGVRTLTSSSAENISTITVEFELGRDMEAAAQDVRDKVARARGRLPDDAEEPLVEKQDADAQAILWLALSSKRYSLLQITDIADKYVKDTLQTVPGVGQVIIGGKRELSMRLWLNPTKMANAGVSTQDIEDALRKENVELPSGRIESHHLEWTVRTLGEINEADQFNRIIVKNTPTGPVYLQDVGYAEIAPKDERTAVRFNGTPAIGLGIVKQSTANTLEVARQVKKRLPALRKNLPAGVSMDTGYDSSLFIERSITEVQESLFLAALLVVGVIYLFLGNLRAALIPAVAIPVSIISTFGLMLILGFTINIFTLLGLTLTIGLVVDDTIIVLENIIRYIEQGDSPLDAALKGTREIMFAVMATTVSLVIVFLPIGFAPGTVSQLFKEFAFVVAGSVILSGFVSLTLAPMLCRLWLKPHAQMSKASPSSKSPSFMAPIMVPIARRLAPLKIYYERVVAQIVLLWDRFMAFYDRLLTWALAHPRQIIGFSLGIMVVCGLTFQLLPSEFLPLEDRGNIITIIRAPEGSTMAYTQKALNKAEAILKQYPEIVKRFAVVGLASAGPGRVNEGIMFTTLVPWEERTLRTPKLATQVQPAMMAIPEAFVFPIAPPSGPQRGFNQPVQFVIQGFNLPEIAEYSSQMVGAMKQQIPGLVSVDSSLKLAKPQINIAINRDLATQLGVSTRDISRTLQILLGGQAITTFKVSSKSYDVMVEALPNFRMTPRAVESLTVKNKSGQMIPLSDLIVIKETVGPKEINHYNRLRSATISATPLPFLPLGKALEEIERLAKTELPPTILTAYSGDSREFKEAGGVFYMMFGLAILFVYLVLSAQFESFRDPFIILLTVPLAVGGAILSLFFLGKGMNVYSQIGMVLLVGLVTKNGILIVEFANQIREHEGLSARDAVYKAAKIRLRPILMTAIAVVFGTLPIALALGASGESRQPLGIAIVGGMIISTALSLLIIPVVYSLVSQGHTQSELAGPKSEQS